MEQLNTANEPVRSQDEGRHSRRVKQGRVSSNKMDKTIIVVTETRVPHPVYGKIVRKSAKFKAHDERNEANIGDIVRIMETRPLSRDKRWRLVEIVEKAK
ncbi:MAG: 30S ribosomal protein S17 [Vulcanimicrobiaceae bacterium]